MKTKWNIEYYQSSQDKTSPIFDFIENLSSKTQAKISNLFDLLEEFGTQVGFPHIKIDRDRTVGTQDCGS